MKKKAVQFVTSSLLVDRAKELFLGSFLKATSMLSMVWLGFAVVGLVLAAFMIHVA